MKISRYLLAASFIFSAASGIASTWIEGSGNIGDAGELRPGQNTIGDSGILDRIEGRFEFNDVDVYKIRIVDRVTFKATMVGHAGTLDTQLFLFNENGRGVTHNDDDPVTNAIQSTITGQFVPVEGVYYLAVTQYNRDPISAPNRFLWLDFPFNTERAPDGNGANEIWTDWTDEPLLDGDYAVQLIGADFAEVGTTPPPPQNNIWAETADAPSLLPGQMTYGEGQLMRIDGRLSHFTDVDMYCIDITDPAQFRAHTVGLVSFDTQLYLFDQNGNGVTFNDDDPAITGSWSALSGQFVTAPGTYYLAVTRWDMDPRSSTGEMWLDEPYVVERAPDGPGAANPLVSWQGGIGRTGLYSITVRGATFCAEGFALVPLQDFALIRGTAVSGGLSEMSQTDNAYGVFGPGITFSTGQAPIEIEFFANISTPTPLSLALLVEGRGSSGGLQQDVSVWDFVALDWVDVDTTILASGAQPDTALTIDLSSIPNLVGPENKVRARIRVRSTGPVFAYPWRASIDQFAWRVQTQ